MSQNDSYTSLDNGLMAEQHVLGAILKNSERLDDLRFLEERDFTSERHKLLWKTFLYMDSRDIVIDRSSVMDRMKANDNVEAIGISYIFELESSCPSSELKSVMYHAKRVRFNANRKRLHTLSDQIKVAADDDYETEEEMFIAVEGLTGDIRPQESGQMLSMAETRAAYKEHLVSKAERMLTGFEQFDEWAQIWRGWLYVLAGRPSVGKTAKALQLVHGVAKNNPDAGAILVFSQEMDTDDLTDRLVSSISGVNYVRLTKHKEDLNESELERIETALDELDKLPINIQDTAAVTIDEIRATVRRFKKKYGKIAMVVVDYLQIMNIPEGKGKNRDQAIGYVTRTAKQLARQYNLCFLMLSQMNRDIEKFDAREPKLSDLKESGSIEQDADVVEFLWHKGEKEENCKVVRSFFAKGRNVGENRFRYKFEWYRMRYKELPKAGDTSDKED